MADDGQQVVAANDNGALVIVAKAIGPTTPKKATAWFLWLLGLYIMLLARAPVEITEEMHNKYMKVMEKARDIDVLRTPVMMKIKEIDAEIYHHTRGIPVMWRFDHRKEVVGSLYQRRDEKMVELQDINYEIEKVHSEAKSELGIWSNRGIEEAREKFWEKLDAGKSFAKRQTLWDAIISVLFNQRRDEEAFSFIVRWIFTIAFNFTIGFFLTLINFMFSLIYVVRSFQPTFISGLFFYFLALLGAASVVLGYLLLTCGLAGGGVYVAYKTVSVNHRLHNRRRYAIREHQD